MQFRRALIPVVAAGLALVQQATAFDVTITQFSCTRLLFTLTITPTEFEDGTTLSILNGPTQVSEIGLDGSYSATVLSADFLAPFFEGEAPTESGPVQLTFILENSAGDQLPSSAPVQRTVDFQCGATVTSSAAPGSTPTNSNGGSSNNDNNNNDGNGSSSNNSDGSSSSSSSNTGAIAGGVVGGIVALAAIGLLVFCLMRKRRRQQRRQGLGRHDVDESATRGPNDSTASLATAPEPDHVETPMMRDISTKNVFADPTSSTGSTGGAPSSHANVAPSSSSHGAGSGAAAAGAAAAAGGLGAAAIAARKQSREQSRERRPSNVSRSGESQQDHAPPLPAPAPAAVPSPPAPKSQPSPPPAPAPAPAAAPVTQTADVSPTSKPVELASASPASEEKADAGTGSGAGAGAGAGVAATAAAAATAATAASQPKTSKWGFKRNSQAEKAKTPADSRSLASTTPSQKSAEEPNSPPRSFKVIQKQPQSPAPAAPGSPTMAPVASGSRSGYATPGSIRQGAGYSRAPSVASLQAGFGEAPAMPPAAPAMAPAGPTASGSASASSMPVGDFAEAGNMAGIGAGRSYQTNSFTGSTNSTKWHQQHYNVMPNYVSRPFARSTQLDEDLIFGNIGMGLNAPPGPAGNGSETGSSRSRRDPFRDA